MSMPKIIGVDFDNTIVCYDAVFYRAALARGVIPTDVPKTKIAVRDHLRNAGKESMWTEIQGEVYGARMTEADSFPGVEAFFRACLEAGATVYIVSHKSLNPHVGVMYNLHAAAREWLEARSFHARVGLPRENVFFELTREHKIERIAGLRCNLFIDDLPEVLNEPGFPGATERLLFDPLEQHTGEGLRRVRTWSEAVSFVNGQTSYD